MVLTQFLFLGIMLALAGLIFTDFKIPVPPTGDMHRYHFCPRGGLLPKGGEVTECKIGQGILLNKGLGIWYHTAMIIMVRATRESKSSRSSTYDLDTRHSTRQGPWLPLTYDTKATGTSMTVKTPHGTGHQSILTASQTPLPPNPTV